MTVIVFFLKGFTARGQHETVSREIDVKKDTWYILCSILTRRIASRVLLNPCTSSDCIVPLVVQETGVVVPSHYSSFIPQKAPHNMMIVHIEYTPEYYVIITVNVVFWIPQGTVALGQHHSAGYCTTSTLKIQKCDNIIPGTVYYCIL